MGVIEDLYHGNFCPAEKIIPDTERYTESKKDATKLAEKLKAELTPEQFDLFETYCNARAVMADEMYCESFRRGMILGAKLWQALQGNEEP